MSRIHPMFLNPVLRRKTYYVYSGDYNNHKPIGEVNADDVHEALKNAREEFGQRARAVVLKDNGTVPKA